MRRMYRTGAAVAAMTSLLTGAGFTFASQRETTVHTPAEVATVSETSPAASDEDLDASLAELRDEAAALKAEIAQEKARKTTAARAEGANRDDPEAAATSRAATKAPATDATTGASGVGEDEDEDRADD